MAKLTTYLDRFLFVIGLTALVMLIIEIGYYLTPEQAWFLRLTAQTLVGGFIIQELIRWYIADSTREFLRERWFEACVALMALVFFAFRSTLWSQIHAYHPTATVTDITLLYLGFSQLIVLLTQITRIFRGASFLSRLTLRPPQLFILSFMVPIIIGTCLLKLPKATTTPISWLDALFTATSAVCVTGLSVVDIGSTFTGIGKTIICFLFQIGGLGIMTFTIFFATLLSGSIGIRERILMSDFLSEQRVGQVRFLLRKIGTFTLSIESLGAVLLYLSTGRTFADFDLHIWYEAVFHSISAFCNAGFSIFSDGLYNDTIRSNYAYTSIIMVLIVLGSLGFPVLSNLTDVITNRFSSDRQHKILTTSTRLILSTTLVLILGGAILIWFSEGRFTFTSLSSFDRFFHSLFLSVTSRSAGFSIAPVGTLSITTSIILMALMWIGGSPMSTAGGVKNVTVAVALLNFRSHILGFRRIEIFGRQIEQDSINRAFAAITISILMLFAGWLTMVILEPGMDVLSLGFEVISAFATAGLSRGVTGELSEASRMVLVILMFSGRVGLITVLSSLFKPPVTHNYSLLKDRVTIY